MKLHTLIPSLLAAFTACALAADPVVTNVRGQQRTGGSELVDVFYDLADSDSPSVTVGLQVSADEGATWSVPVTTVSQAVGPGVTPGKDRHILWNAGADWNNQYSNKVRFKVTASDFAPIGNMVPIPGGTFQMGDNFNEGWSGEVPVHSVTVNAFYLQNTEVTKAQWDAVANWAAANGYDINAAGGSGKAANHPVYYVTWYEVVKYCNARSQMENLTPCYTVGGVTYKTGSSAPDCNWSASGYRLPTEAEWERAARGGESGRRFPWGDIINHSHANYYNSSYSYESPQNQGHHPTYNDGVSPYTSPVGSFPANGYGLYDMAGNLWEWCWDWYGSYPAGSQINPSGPASGSARVGRGGDWFFLAIYCRVAYRDFSSPGFSYGYVGFRPARSSVP